jgi:hypothetical protein
MYKIEKFDSVLLTNKGLIGKENSIWGGNFKNGCFRTQLDFSKFHWIYWGLNCKKKIIFKVNLDFNWKKLKSGGRIAIFRS